MNVYNANDLIRYLVSALSELWDGYTGYPDALPEPSKDRSVDRSPMFVVTAERGAFSYLETHGASVEIRVGIQVCSDASTDDKNYSWAIRTLRDRIDEFCLWLYNTPGGVKCGVRPGSVSWEVPAVQPRPVYQAMITVNFELPRSAGSNDNFLC